MDRLFECGDALSLVGYVGLGAVYGHRANNMLELVMHRIKRLNPRTTLKYGEVIHQYRNVYRWSHIRHDRQQNHDS